MINRKISHPTIIIIRGLPGSGKTFFAKEFAKEFDPQNVIMLDPDVVNQDSDAYKEHVAQADAEGVHPKLHLYRFLRAQAYKAIADHKTIIWNQPFTNLEIFNKMMTNLHLQARENNTELAVLVVEVEIDQAMAKARVQARKETGGQGPTEKTFTRFTNDYHSFADDGYKTITINGAAAIGDSVRLVTEALENL